jgi:hypothetical protein
LSLLSCPHNRHSTHNSFHSDDDDDHQPFAQITRDPTHLIQKHTQILRARARSPKKRREREERESKQKRAIMSAAAAWVLPEKYTEDLKDENGEAMSKR